MKNKTRIRKKKQLKQRPEIHSFVCCSPMCIWTLQVIESIRWIRKQKCHCTTLPTQCVFESGGIRMGVSGIREIIEMWQQMKRKLFRLTSDRRPSSTKRTANYYRMQCAQLTAEKSAVGLQENHLRKKKWEKTHFCSKWMRWVLKCEQSRAHADKLISSKSDSVHSERANERCNKSINVTKCD